MHGFEKNDLFSFAVLEIRLPAAEENIQGKYIPGNYL